MTSRSHQREKRELKHYRPEPEPDTDEWTVALGGRIGNDGRQIECPVISSDDFEHDVRLFVAGDFESQDQAMAYARGIADRLNSTKPSGRTE